MQFQRKIFFISLLLIALVLLGLIAHYFSFRKEYEKAPAELRSPQEFNAYLVRHHHFDSVILGSSLSMNFRCSDFDTLCGGYSYKLTVQGCGVPLWTAIAQYVCRHRKIRAVLADIPLETLLVPPANMDNVEKYYTDNRKLWTDFREGASVKTIRARRLFYWNKIRRSGKKELPFSRDDLHSWSKKYPCGKLVIARSVTVHQNKPADNRDRAHIRTNMDPLLEFIRRHREIRFYLYLPPCSVLAYDNKELFFSVRKDVMDMLLALPNVELYDFQAADCVTDFDKYKDVTHYSQEISSWIIRQMKEKKYLVTQENRSGFEKRFADKILPFDCEKAIRELKEYYYANASRDKKRK